MFFFKSGFQRVANPIDRLATPLRAPYHLRLWMEGGSFRTMSLGLRFTLPHDVPRSKVHIAARLLFFDSPYALLAIALSIRLLLFVILITKRSDLLSENDSGPAVRMLCG